MPASDSLLLRVAAAWPLPGLGVLVVPTGATPRLACYPLHTALTVAAATEGTRVPAAATVEEIVREGNVARGLLLDFGSANIPPLPPGTSIWLLKDAPGHMG
jgi:hypothetical protein